MGLLKIKNAEKVYSDNIVWKNLNLVLTEGEIVGLIGANGSGKTTLFKAILGLINLSNGKIETKLNIEEDIGYLLEIELFNNLNARENLRLLGMYSGKEYSQLQIENALKKVGLDGVGNKRVGSFSFGMKQRLRLAAATIIPRKLLLLDEPLVGLDPNGIERFLQTIEKISATEGTAIVISTHQISEVSSLFDKYYYFLDKQLHEAEIREAHYEIIIEPNLKVEQLLRGMRCELRNDDTIITQDVQTTVKIISTLYTNEIQIKKINNHDSIVKEIF